MLVTKPCVVVTTPSLSKDLLNQVKSITLKCEDFMQENNIFNRTISFNAVPEFYSFQQKKSPVSIPHTYRTFFIFNSPPIELEDFCICHYSYAYTHKISAAMLSIQKTFVERS